MKRLYDQLIKEHISTNRQMAFLTGPRQVGKTTLAEKLTSIKLHINWDNQAHRALVLKGPDIVAEKLGLSMIYKDLPVIVFDEIHKYNKWKTFLKGFFDTYQKKCRVIVTGSGRLNVYKRGGDSLMGRYFIYRMHPLSIAELVTTDLNENLIRMPKPTLTDQMDALLTFGGFPEPFLRGNKRFYNKWRKLRTEQLFYEDLRDFSMVQEIKQIEILAECLIASVGNQINYSSFAKTINASVDSIRRWISLLNSVYFSFDIRPWHTNVSKSIRKQPKIYMIDWSLITDTGAQKENMIAVHLKKAVDFWTDMGLGEFGLYYIRDKTQREVDFVIVRDSKPWFMVEVKSSGSKSISKHLRHFHKVLKTENAFQIVFNHDFVEKDCFEEKAPVIVPASTFLSQLV